MVSAISTKSTRNEMTMQETQSAARWLSVTARLLDIAQLGHAQWLFGNIYEAVVKIPERLSPKASDQADARNNAGPTSVLGPGSPVRYYAPVAPITLASTAAAVVAGWGAEGARRWLTIAAGCSVVGLAITAYLIRAVNLKVMFAAEPPPPAERDARIRLWYRLNIVRIATAGGALFAAHRAQQAIATRLAE
jgi:Anthrone oxygenase